MGVGEKTYTSRGSKVWQPGEIEMRILWAVC